MNLVLVRMVEGRGVPEGVGGGMGLVDGAMGLVSSMETCTGLTRFAKVKLFNGLCLSV